MNSAQVSEKAGVCVRPRKDWSVGEAGGGVGRRGGASLKRSPFRV